MKNFCRLLPCLLIGMAVLCAGSQAEAVDDSAIEVTPSFTFTAPEEPVSFWAKTDEVVGMQIVIKEADGSIVEYSPADGVYNSNSGRYEWNDLEILEQNKYYEVSYLVEGNGGFEEISKRTLVSAIEIIPSFTLTDTASRKVVDFWAKATENVASMWLEIKKVDGSVVYSSADAEGEYDSNSERYQYDWAVNEAVFDADGTYIVRYHGEISDGASFVAEETTSVVKSTGSPCSPLNAFNLTAPAPDEDVRFPSVTLEWEPASSPECSDVTYTVMLARFDFDADVEELSAASDEVIFSDPVQNEDLEELQDINFKLKNVGPGIYFWKVIAKEGVNETGSDRRMFKLRPLQLLSPEDGFEFSSPSFPVPLFWEDMESSDITYRLYIDQFDADSKAYEMTYEYPLPDESPLLNHFYVFDSTESHKKYLWEVEALQGNNIVARSNGYWLKYKNDQLPHGTLEGVIKTKGIFDYSYMMENLSLTFYNAEDEFTLTPNDIGENMILSIDEGTQTFMAQIRDDKCGETYRIKVAVDGYLPVVIENKNISHSNSANINDVTLRLMGDIDDSGEVTGDDIKRAFEMFAGFRSPDSVADMNSDSEINLKDISTISARAANGI